MALRGCKPYRLLFQDARPPGHTRLRRAQRAKPIRRCVVVGHVNVLHVVPENGAVERFGCSHRLATPLRYGPAADSAREQLGSVCLHFGDGETAKQFLDEVGTRVTQTLGSGIETSKSEGKMVAGMAWSKEQPTGLLRWSRLYARRRVRDSTSGRTASRPSMRRRHIPSPLSALPAPHPVGSSRMPA